MKITRSRLGQLDPSAIAASELPVSSGFKLSHLFFISVAAGVAVWFITRFFDRRK